MRKKIVFILLISGLIPSMSFSQKSDLPRTIKENTDIFHGTWRAQQGNNQYEIVIKRDFMIIEGGEIVQPGKREYVWGKVIYFENGEKVRETADNVDEAVIRSGWDYDPFEINFIYRDLDGRFERDLDFIIDENDPKKAVLRFDSIKSYQKRPGWNQTDPFPDGMTWTKVE
ncbi:MAG: hypothetical protein LIO77_08005 [Rikenellaceae bacterium]|nr:hypothetical protein [Rikenellaceae bacterium]